MSPRRSVARRPAVVAFFLLLTIIGWRTDVFGGQLTLTWADSSTSELGFSVERSAGATGAFSEVGSTGTGVTAYTDGTVSDATTYCYRVRAYDSTTYSDYSNVACGTTAQGFGLTVVAAGTGAGAVISSPSGIICGATCSASFASGATVILTATPATGSTFGGWSGGGCGGTGTCTVTLTAATTVTATFVSQSATLVVSPAGSGTGTVTSTPPGISCGTSCSGSYPVGTAVTLTATAATSSTFGGWSGGGCGGTGTCTVTLTAATTVTATFNSLPVTLKVSRNGTGSGTITSSPTGINCGGCSATFPGGTVVTLTATAATGSVFAGWSGGGCSGTSPCSLTLTAPTTVTATFSKLQILKVSTSGTGSGTVSSAPAGISCGTICSAGYPSGTVVTLTATARAGSAFTGWSGSGCSGTGSCVVTLSGNKGVTATFK